MPLPRLVARLNKRYTNRLVEPFVRRFPGFASVAHIGRISGTPYRTPVYTFGCEDDLLVALTYGPRADWAQNVRFGSATLVRGNNEFAVVENAIVDRAVAWPCLPLVVRGWLRILRVEDFMLLRVDQAR